MTASEAAKGADAMPSGKDTASQSRSASVAAVEAGWLLQQVLQPAALLKMLGLATRDPTSAGLCTSKVGQPETTQALHVSQGVGGTVATEASAEAAARADNGALPGKCEVQPEQPMPVPGHGRGVSGEQQQQPEHTAPGHSLLAMLGLGVGASASKGGQAGASHPDSGKEEDEEGRLAQLGGIVMDLVEVLLECLMTEPQVTCSYYTLLLSCQLSVNL